MKPTLLCAGRLFASASLCFALTGYALAAASPPFTLLSATPRTLTQATLVTAQKTETACRPSSDKETLSFPAKIVRLIAVTGPENDMLSYRIAGLRNPTLRVSRRAVIKMLFVNTDDDMRHNLRFGSALKIYPNGITPYIQSSAGAPEISHVSGAVVHGEEMTVRVPAVAGSYVYLCTVRGHAQGGMVGRVEVR